MTKSNLFFIIILFIILTFILIFILINSNITNNQSSNYDTSYLSYNSINNTTNNKNQFQKEISNFSTKIKDNSPGRLNNIRLTCNTINNSIINPGEIFSFNNIVGKPTVQKGYMEAHVIINNKLTNGIGGR